MCWPVTPFRLCLKTSNVGRKNVKVVKIEPLSWKTSDFGIKYSLIRQPSEHNIYRTYISTCVPTYSLPIYKLGVLHYKIFNEIASRSQNL